VDQGHRQEAVAFGGVAIVLLGFAIAPLHSIQFGQSSPKSQGTTSKAYQTLATLERGGIGSGALTPIVVLSNGSAAQTTAIADASRAVAGIRAAVVNPPGKNGYTAIDVIPDRETVASSSVAIVDRVSKNAKALPGWARRSSTIATRSMTISPYVIGLIAVITFILLVRTFRSILLPLKAVVLNLVSLAAVMGVSTWFWEDRHGSHAVFGVAATGA
jgi:putative drug exporter of the RND superfamily